MYPDINRLSPTYGQFINLRASIWVTAQLDYVLRRNILKCTKHGIS